MKKNTLKIYGLLACVSILASCDVGGSEFQINRGDPERFLYNSSEEVTIGLDSANALSHITSIVDKDRPTGVELRCSIKDVRCAQAKEIIERRSIQIYLNNEWANSVVMLYNRNVVGDCEQRYVDNTRGSRSVNHPAFGCSVAGNIVQMVADKKQFTEPAILDLPDAEKANQSYSNYLRPSNERESGDTEWITSDK
ncbi:MAG: hypothetical protein R3D71_00645 [Rickettsiales bacterium]